MSDQLLEGEAALNLTNGELRIGNGSTMGGAYIVPGFIISQLNEGDSLQWKNGQFVHVPRQAAVADPNNGNPLPDLSSESTEVQDAFSEMETQMQDLRNTVSELLQRLRTSTGNGTLAG